MKIYLILTNDAYFWMICYHTLN